MAEKTVNGRIQQRIDTSANWASTNLILLSGELGVESDTGKIKVGDGILTWNSLKYLDSDTLDGKHSSDFATVAQGIKADTAVQDSSYVHTDNNYTTADKTKLNSIDAGANNYSLPKASTTVLGGIKVGENLSVDADGVLSATASEIEVKLANAAYIGQDSDSVQLAPKLLHDNGGALISPITTPDCVRMSDGRNISRFLYNVNLLDNSDFTNPVNQRGAVAPFASGYCIDRWIWSPTTGGRCSLSSEGIVISNGGGTLTQKLENSIGNSFTASIGLVNGVAIAAYDDTSKTFVITCYGNTTISWAKLEKGSVATPWQPKGYGVEMAECQRYFTASNLTITMPEVPGSVRRVSIYFPVQMRTVPTITKISENGTVNVIQTTVDGFRLGSDTGNNYLGGYTASADL